MDKKKLVAKKMSAQEQAEFDAGYSGSTSSGQIA
jgi:hypothetical protein